jgi:hypothetical protein
MKPNLPNIPLLDAFQVGRIKRRATTTTGNAGDAILRADGTSAIKRPDGTSDIVRP